jgi:hypothetical protein
MLRCLSGMVGYRIRALDGEIGRIHDFPFDDFEWVVRYIVEDAGSLLSRKRVLIFPALAGHPQWNEQVLPVALTVEQVKASPDIDTDKPISRQRRGAMAIAYGPVSWTPDAAPPPHLMPRPSVLSQTAWGDPNLRSMQHVLGYGIHASDGDLGHVYDFIVEDDRWSIRYMAVATERVAARAQSSDCLAMDRRDYLGDARSQVGFDAGRHQEQP